MKILFVSSGNIKYSDIAPFIKAQGQSLRDLGHDVVYFPIRGKGMAGYLKNVRPLGKFVSEQEFDVLHAHYSLSGVVAWLAFRTYRKQQNNESKNSRSSRPAVIVSLLGSDVNSKVCRRSLLRLISGIWDKIIVKSDEMWDKLRIKRARVLPNGVNLKSFLSLDRSSCRRELGLDNDKRYVLFAADPEREVKNYPLAKAAFSQLTTDNCEMITLGNVSHSKIPVYINACDVLILTSLWEGSPNIVKEAMACNIPIVSTPVGDVKWLFGDLEGHYLAKPIPGEFAAKLEEAFKFHGRTKGRERLIELGLDSETVARKLIDIYHKACKDKGT